jgi:hypothetical protein
MSGRYFKRLAIHPGVPVASAFTAFGFLYGLADGGFAQGAITCLLASVIWVPVLITARNQPLPRDLDNG